MLSASHIGIVAAVVVLLFGTKRLPELGTGLGRAITNFKNSFKDVTEGQGTTEAPKNEAISKSAESK